MSACPHVSGCVGSVLKSCGDVSWSALPRTILGGEIKSQNVAGG
jgi:hypothetical protein